MSARQPARVVIVGGGYAAIWAYRALARLGDRVAVTVISAQMVHAYHGFTGEVLGGELQPHHVETPLTVLMPRARVLHDTVVRVLPEERAVETAGGLYLHYDQLLAANGSRTAVESVPGLAAHGLRLRDAGDTRRILDHLRARAAEAAAGGADRAALTTVVVAGGGFAGTETAAALGRRRDLSARIVLVSGMSPPVPAWRNRAALARGIDRSLAEAGVEVLSGVRVAEVTAAAVRLSDGRTVPAATVIAALGDVITPLRGLEPWARPDGRLRVDGTFRVAERIWSAGDAAAQRRPLARGALAPRDALWAITGGGSAGRNIGRALRGRRARPFGFPGMGAAASFAPGNSVATFLGVPLNRSLGYAIRTVLFLWFFPSRRGAAAILAQLPRIARDHRSAATAAAAAESEAAVAA